MSELIEQRGHSPVIDDEGVEVSVIPADKGYFLLYPERTPSYVKVKASTLEKMRARYLTNGAEAFPQDQERKEEKVIPEKEKSEPVPEKTTTKKKVEKKVDNEAIANKLLTAAEKMQSSIDAISTDYSHLNPTPKRTRQLEANIAKQDRLIEYQSILRNLGEAWLGNDVPDIIKQVRSKGDVEALRQHSYPATPDKEEDKEWYIEQQEKSIKKRNKLGIFNQEDQDLAKSTIEGYMSSKSPEEIAEQKFESKLRELRNTKIPGFFPTPDDLCDTLVEYAQLENNLNYLEPSCGIGSILDAIERIGDNNGWLEYNIDSYETQHSLIEILHHKGHDTIQQDFKQVEVIQQYDRVIMNPPFENAQDVDHIGHAWQMLNKGGRLVAIASSAVLHNLKGRYPKFRNWLTGSEDEIRTEEGVEWNFSGTAGSGIIMKLPENSFKSAFRSTGVSCVLIVIDK